MNRLSLLISFGLGVCAPFAMAHGPTPLKVDEQIILAAPPEKVWAVVGAFDAPQRWNPEIRATRADKSDKPGAVRLLTLANGGEVEELLDERDDAKRTLSYRSGRVDPKGLPVSSYSARIQISPEGAGSRVAWQARVYRADTGNSPPPGADDAAAVEALQTLMRSGFDSLKRDFGPGA